MPARNRRKRLSMRAWRRIAKARAPCYAALETAFSLGLGGFGVL
jgi:hypothetical protein